jgi:hypothetical protein
MIASDVEFIFAASGEPLALTACHSSFEPGALHRGGGQQKPRILKTSRCRQRETQTYIPLNERERDGKRERERARERKKERFPRFCALLQKPLIRST